MDRVAVIGGGLAGLSAAAALAVRGFRVTVLESRQRAFREELENCNLSGNGVYQELSGSIIRCGGILLELIGWL